MKKLLIKILFKNYIEDLRKRISKDDFTTLDILKLKYVLLKAERKLKNEKKTK